MRIAILEDDTLQSEMLALWLRDASHDVYCFADARDFMRIAARESFDFFLLDSILPQLSGQEVLEWLRKERNNDTPVVFVTARDAEEDVVAALSGGADDYIVKPVRRWELLARVDAVLRRGRSQGNEQVVEVGPYRFDVTHKQAQLDGAGLELTDKEFDLAVFLFRNLGRLVSRGHMLEAVWGRSPTVATRTVDTHISRVRTKLELRPERGYRLVPAYNFGYRLERVGAEAGEAA
ncbi:MAG TPA: response regulator transcription factor [Aromatoleum sp.]|uniref:response regulator transcription factor n=1 Tax=Aromatoleum sp. TaxID=2307007 RepID=UPI002B470A87|nr:response regulator transcription factor [Aromatoleum sp.]HJV28035.1 response regulator transcription factor [Aromatoleum sp.]